jgi:hypothetical protein
MNQPRIRTGELNQLWIIGKHYFNLSKRIKNKLSSKPLKLKPKDIAKLCNAKSKTKVNLRQIMLITAHLASSAVRLSTIDEILGRNYSKRLKVYKK